LGDLLYQPAARAFDLMARGPAAPEREVVGVPMEHAQDNREWDASQLVIAEYTNLRAEIIKLTELQFQTTAVCVVAFGTVLSVGLQARSAAVILIYPLLSLVLGVVWLHHAHLITRIAAYVREDIEDRVGHRIMRWEHAVQAKPLTHGLLAYWGIRAIFPVSSILALVAALPVPLSGAGVLLYVPAGGTTMAAMVIFVVWREPSPELSGAPR